MSASVHQDHFFPSRADPEVQRQRQIQALRGVHSVTYSFPRWRLSDRRSVAKNPLRSTCAGTARTWRSGPGSRDRRTARHGSFVDSL